MNINQRKSRWKIYLAIAGLLIVLLSFWYTRSLSRKLAEEERKHVTIWVQSLTDLTAPITNDCINCLNCQDFTLQSMIQEANTTIPVMLVSKQGAIIDAFNFGTRDSLKLLRELSAIMEDGQDPILAADQLVYFKESNVLRMLRYYPLLQFLLIGAFVGVSYLAFSISRKSEQNQVWVGMAKETAHQLGTPLSALIAWIEHLKMIRGDDTEVMEVVHELAHDVEKLELVTDRFSKIGSLPELKPTNLYHHLEQSRAYMKKRAPRKVIFDFPDPEQAALPVLMNAALFNWVIENLLRNALDAMDGTGTISLDIIEEPEWVNIDLSDTGKGIPSGKHKTVFQPGYSTKKRGWGLGLSLAKRIIEEYHKGKIFVKQSEPGKGTTFTIRLRKG